MLQNLPIYISIVFGLTAIATLLLFYFAIKNSTSDNSKSSATTFAIILIVWLLIQAVLTLNNFYNTDTTSNPPKFIWLVGPPLLTIGILFTTSQGRKFVDSLPLINLTYLNIVRIPVELVLYWLFLNKAVPELMTFTGRNFDILAGITAPFAAYFGLQRKGTQKKLLLIWNVMALGLLLNIVFNAVLSAPFSFQKFAIDQPNIAVLNFPFSWLPGYIVPTVLFGHLASIRQLLR